MLVNLRMKTFASVIRPLGGKGMGRLPGGNLIYRGLVRYLIPAGISTVKYDGFTLEVYRRGYPGMLVDDGSKYLPTETKAFKNMIRPGMTVLNVGASVGYYTLVSARLVGPTGKVYAFEPFPEAFSLLKRNVEKSGFKNITLVDKAIADFTGSSKFYLSSTNPLANSLGSGRTDSRYIEVPTTTLDEFLGDTKVDVIRMDIEGAEPLALKGMRSLLERNTRLEMHMEFDPLALEGLGFSPQEYIRDLLEVFDLQVLSFRTEILSPYKNMEQIRQSLSYKQGTTHLICTRKEA